MSGGRTDRRGVVSGWEEQGGATKGSKHTRSFSQEDGLSCNRQGSQEERRQGAVGGREGMNVKIVSSGQATLTTEEGPERP